MTYKELFYFTGQCLSLDEHPAFRKTIVQKILADEIIWERFVQLCSDHLIIPAIYLKFKAHDLLSILPEDLAQVLTEIYKLNRERNAKILLQIDHIAAALLPEKIDPVFLKGSANLLDGLYSDLGERMMGDIDFLVKEENYIKTAAIMKEMGYRHEPVNYLDVSRLNHYPRLHRQGFADIEIHRIPVYEKYSISFNANAVFNHKMEVPGQSKLHVPFDAHKLIHTFIHSQLSDHGHAYKQLSFRDLNDLYLLSKRIDVSSLVKQTGYRHKAICWLVFGQRVLGLPGSLYNRETNRAKWFCWKYNLALKFIKMYNAYIILKKIIYLILVRYAGGFLKAVFYKDERQFVYNRLKSPQWYGAHLMSFKEYF